MKNNVVSPVVRKTIIQKMMILRPIIQKEYNKMINSKEYKELQEEIKNFSLRYKNGYTNKSLEIELRIIQLKKHQCMDSFYKVYIKGVKLMFRVPPTIETMQEQNVIISFSHFIQSFKLL